MKYSIETNLVRFPCPIDENIRLQIKAYPMQLYQELNNRRYSASAAATQIQHNFVEGPVV